jgi:hypothetical protein
MYLRPHWITLGAAIVASIALIAIGIGLSLLNGDYPLYVTAPLAVLGLFLGIRCLRMGIVCTSELATIRSIFFTRQVPRASISRIRGRGEAQWWNLGFGTLPPIMEWTDERGRKKKTKLWEIASYSANPETSWASVDAHAADNLRRFKEWRTFGRLA